MGRLVKLIGSGIGLASEAIAHHKASNAANASSSSNAGESSSAAASRALHTDAPPQYVEAPEEHAEQLIAQGRALPADSKDADEEVSHKSHDDDDNDATSEEGDEEQWELDEATDPLTEQGSEEEPAQDVNVLTDTFMKNHPPPAYTPSETGVKGQLPCPVILPQRRPRDKKRGFVRAYAPVLGDCGIDQATFLDFLKTFHQACKESPWLQVVNIAAFGAGMVPSPIAMGVSIAVQLAVGVAMEVQRRTRTNGFLDRMNEEFFKPRGLYCLIMTYKPDSTATHVSVDITQTISSSLTPASSNMRQTFKNMRLSSGKTYGELELPEAAPLIFPALESIASDPTEEGIKKQNKLKSSHKFVADYFDRRAQAQYAGENPGSKLTAMGHEPKFASRYADPNHPANSGSLVSLLTGGVINPQRRRVAKRERRAIRRGKEVTPVTGKKEGIVKRILKKDVLYLMIVNLPSEAELQAGKESVANEVRQ